MSDYPPKKSKIISFLEKQFSAWQGEEREIHNTVEDSPLAGGFSDPFSAGIRDEEPDYRDTIDISDLPIEREQLYERYDEMSQDPTLSEGINIHISHALATDKKSGKAFELKSNSPEWDEITKDLNENVLPLIHENILAWSETMCQYGVNYVRPYATENVGITHLECNYYTLPHFTREYERRGMIAGYTNQHLRKKERQGATTLAPPWSLIPLKIPFFTPNYKVEPKNYSGELYSLFDDNFHQNVIETQNYGISFFSRSYVPFRDLKEALESLRASRQNASRIDRLILAHLENLDPDAAAEYMMIIGDQMKANQEESERRNSKHKTKQLIQNSILPSMQGKGGVTIDTHSTDPNIQHIEDINFHLKRLSASIGIDVSMLGWADTMSGGLGEGGFLRTAIQAARRAAWIRVAVEKFVFSVSNLHLWYKYKKTFVSGIAPPFKLVFNSMNTAIEEQESAERENKASFATIIASLVDTIIQGSTSKSPTLTKKLLGDSLEISDDELKLILTELKSAETNEEDAVFSSYKTDEELERDHLISLLNQAMEVSDV